MELDEQPVIHNNHLSFIIITNKGDNKMLMTTEIVLLILVCVFSCCGVSTTRKITGDACAFYVTLFTIALCVLIICECYKMI